MAQFLQPRSRLLTGRDWTRIYRSFEDANFTAYDFRMLRRAFVDYIRRNFPEDFNDFVDSSEFIALVDILAWLGQSISFRVDLNARENFIDTASRQESILRLARLLSYRVPRALPARGLLKVTGITTTVNVRDSTGESLAGRKIVWNDPVDERWNERFFLALDSALAATNRFGHPIQRGTTFENESFQIYRIATTATSTGVYGFTTDVARRSMNFEATSARWDDVAGFVETSPGPARPLDVVLLQDGNGNASARTGLFVYFKQGTLGRQDFVVTEEVPNMVLDIDVDDINDIDVWVQNVFTDGTVQMEWTKVPSVSAFNIVYNDIPPSVRHIFEVRTRERDRIAVVFGDGRFGAIPAGTIRVWYRTSIGDSFTIRAGEIRDVPITVPFIDRDGRSQILTLYLTLAESVSNAAPRQDLEEIRIAAPASFYARGRMVTGEDYASLPLSVPGVLKAKATVRNFVGHSRYAPVGDPTGALLPLTVHGSDGILFVEETTAELVVTTGILGTVAEIMEALVDQMASPEFRTFAWRALRAALVFDPEVSAALEPPGSGVMWDRASSGRWSTTGRFVAIGPVPVPESEPALSVGTGTSGAMTLLAAIRPGSLVKFAKAGWVPIVSVVDNGKGTSEGFQEDGRGKIELGRAVEEGDIVETVLPPVRFGFDTSEADAIESALELGTTFALRFDVLGGRWDVLVQPGGVGAGFDRNAPFEYGSTVTGWFVLVEPTDETGTRWRIFTRRSRLVFESENVEFHHTGERDTVVFPRSNPSPQYEPSRVPQWSASTAYTAGSVVEKDGTVYVATGSPTVGIFLASDWLCVSPGLPTDVKLEVVSRYTYPGGGVEPRRLVLAISDSDADGIPDDPDAFDLVVLGNENPFDPPEDRVVVWRAGTLVDGRRTESRVNALVFAGTDATAALAAMDAHYLDPATRAEWTDGRIGVAVGNDGSLTVVEFDIDNAYVGTDTNIPDGLTVGDPRVPSLQSRPDPLLFRVAVGRPNLAWTWEHRVPTDVTVDPALANVVEVFVLTRSYHRDILAWKAAGADPARMPSAPKPFELEGMFSELVKLRAVADRIVWRPVRFLPLFGNGAAPEYRAVFRVVPTPGTDLAPGEIRSRVVTVIEEFFDPDEWQPGERFYFSELAALVHARLAGDISSIALVPLSASSVFGDLYEIKMADDELPLSVATVDDVEIIDSNTPVNLRIVRG